MDPNNLIVGNPLIPYWDPKALQLYFEKTSKINKGIKVYFVGGHIDGTDFDDSFEGFGSFFPFGCQIFTMAAPGSIEFDEPDFVGFDDLGLEIA